MRKDKGLELHASSNVNNLILPNCNKYMHEEELLTSKNSFNRLQCIILKFIIFINLGFESYIILSLNYLHPRPEKFPPPYLRGPNYVFIEKNWSANRLADRFHCAGFGLR